ncbi:peptidase domain-containing ABC transporter [Peristeroidobacter agariperforans]|uniref:peptidase domain-containing ABC transporter n=1 Tax=Peristeroidobacter agariperforans TaxID=268404 RepID=UPI00101DB963|nr:peptidase domain-containing ABC transporter [Peristeroidobacter agariperforans]
MQWKRQPAHPGPLATALSVEEFLWCLASLCQLHRQPFDHALVASQYPGPHTTLTLIEAAGQLGLKCGLRAEQAGDVRSWAFPCIAFVRSGGASDEPRPTLVLQADAERVLLLKAGDTAPSTLPCSSFAEMFAGEVFFAAPAAKATTEEQDGAASRAFGFRWFVPELLKYRSIWRDVLLASLAIQLMALATPLFTQVVIDKVVVHHTMNTLVVVGVAMAAFMVFSSIMSWVRQYLILHTGNRIDAVLGSRVFEHLIKLPLRYYESRPTGTVVARLQGVEQIREFIASAAVTVLLDCPFLLIFLAIMFYYSVPLTLLSLLILGVIIALSIAVAPILRDRLNQQFLLGARNQAFLTEYISGMETLKSLQMEPQLKRRFGDMLATYMSAGFKTRQLGNTYHTLAQLLEQLMTLSILCYGAYLVMKQPQFTIGMLVAFQMFAGRLSQPLLRLVGLWQQFQQADISVRRLGDLMNAPTEPYSVVPQRDVSGGAGRLEMRAIAFRYSEQLPFLYEKLSLTAQPGQCIGIMGPSGSGKSTLAKLLQGFYWPSEGQILLDNRDTRYLSANELRQHLGVVPQETVLFSGTVYENLQLANPHATFEQIVQACRMAEIHEVIEKLPKGYQTVIGERGVGLSGGQRQRIAIARALLKRPKVLIFDEAISSLDAHTAEQFGKTINSLKGRVTIVFITHQLPRSLKLDAVYEIGKPGGEEKRFEIIRGRAADGPATEA